MKLTVNKTHEEGTFKKKVNKTYLKFGSLFVAASMFSGLLTSALLYNEGLEEVARVTADTRRSLYFDNDLYDKTKYYAYKTIEEDGETYIAIDYDVPNEDLAITYESLAKAKELRIDLKRTPDFAFLKYCSNLESLYINNAILLSDENIAILNNSNIDKVYLTFDNNELSKLNCNVSNLLKLKRSIEITNISTNELEDLHLYYLKEKLPNNFIIHVFDYEKCSLLNNKINELIGEIDFSEITTEKDKLFKIIEKVCEYIEYDEAINNITEYNEESDAHQKIINYNENVLSSLFNQNGNSVKGICCNYSALLSALCTKLGIESHYIDGKVTSSTIYGHAWNLIKIDGEYKLVDLNAIEFDASYQSLYKNYLEENFEYNSEEWFLKTLQDEVFNNLDEQTKSIYKPQINIKKITEAKTAYPEIIYYNIESEGELVNHKGVDIKLPLIIGFGSGVICVIISTGIQKKKEEKYENILK